MRIQKLVLKDWARHRALEKDIDASIVGIVGRNASGKSSVLAALKFLITGVTEDDIASYVRREGGQPVKNSQVELTFSQHGTQGRITRKVTKSGSTRCLEWDGLEITAAKDFDQKIGEILGTSRKALQNCVFIAQGELNKFLFGQKADQELLFTRLLLLEHLELVAKQADQQMAALSTGIEDFSLSLDEVMAQRKIAEANLAEARQKLEASKDWAEDIDTLTSYRDFYARLEENNPQTRLSELQGRIDQLEQQRAAGVADLSVLSGIPVEIRELFGITDKAKALQTVGFLNHWTPVYSKHKADHGTQLTKLTQQTTYLEQQQATLKSLQEQLQGASQVTQVEIDSWRTREEIMRQRQSKQVERDCEVEAFSKHDLLLSGSQKQVVPCEAAVTAATEKLETLRTALGKPLESMRLRVGLAETQRSNLAKFGKDATAECCPVCNHSLEGSLIADTELAELKALVADAQEQLTTAESTKKKAETELTKLRSDIAGLEKSKTASGLKVATLTQELEVLAEQAGFYTVEQVTKEIEELLQKRAVRTSLEVRVAEATATVTQAQKNQTDTKAAADSLQAKLEELKAQNPEITGALLKLTGFEGFPQAWGEQVENTLNTQKAEAQEIAKAIAELQAGKQQVVEQLQQVIATKEALEAKRESTLKRAADIAGGSPDLLTALKEIQAGREQLVGEVRALDSSANMLLFRQRDIEQKIQMIGARKQVIDELKQLKQLFSREGLPKAYCKKKFLELIPAVNTVLADMDSVFFVDADPERDLTFRFQRFDEENPSWYSQTKLSGGQRTRLTIAFLLALQRQILPDIGLLVLDEPTESLDEASKEALATVISNLGNVLEASGFQIVLCDHSPQMKTAARKLIDLDNATPTA
jgi:DNA repair exonuclease SbcCD ATPase subunit